MDALKTALGIDTLETTVTNHTTQISAKADKAPVLLYDKTRDNGGANWTTGSKTIPGISNYSHLLLTLGGGNWTGGVFCFKNQTSTALGCNTISANNSTTTQTSIVFAPTMSGDSLTYPAYPYYMFHNGSGTHGVDTLVTSSIDTIYGII